MKHELHHLLLRIDTILSVKYETVYDIPEETRNRVFRMNREVSNLVEQALFGFTNIKDNQENFHAQFGIGSGMSEMLIMKIAISMIIKDKDLSESEHEKVRLLKNTPKHTQISSAVTKLQSDLRTYITTNLPTLMEEANDELNRLIIRVIKGNLCSRLSLVADGTGKEYLAFAESVFN